MITKDLLETLMLTKASIDSTVIWLEGVSRAISKIHEECDSRQIVNVSDQKQVQEEEITL